MIGLAYAKILEEHLVQLVVVVLARVHEHVIAVLIEPRDDARQANDFRPRTDDVRTLSFFTASPSSATVSGALSSNISLAHSMTIEVIRARRW